MSTSLPPSTSHPEISPHPASAFTLEGRAVHSLELPFSSIGTSLASPNARERVYGGAKRLAEYCHDEGVQDLILVDRKARPAWVAFSEYWNLAYGEEEVDRPDIHFVSPTFTTLGKIATLIPAVRSIVTSRTASKLEQEASASNRPNFSDNPERPVVLFDACMHSGLTMTVTKGALELCGLKDVRVAVNQQTSKILTDVKPDLVLAPANAAETHMPFGRDGLVKRQRGKVQAVPETDPQLRRRARALRLNLRAVVREEYMREQKIS